MITTYLREPQFITVIPREEGGYDVAFREAGLEYIYIDGKFYQIDLDVKIRTEFMKEYGHLRQEGQEGNRKYAELMNELYQEKGFQAEQKVMSEKGDMKDFIENLIS